ncbi:hypothetical protein CI238_08512, partial [Colletotrichum incanum]
HIRVFDASTVAKEHGLGQLPVRGGPVDEPHSNALGERLREFLVVCGMSNVINCLAQKELKGSALARSGCVWEHIVPDLLAKLARGDAARVGVVENQLVHDGEVTRLPLDGIEIGHDDSVFLELGEPVRHAVGVLGLLGRLRVGPRKGFALAVELEQGPRHSRQRPI